MNRGRAGQQLPAAAVKVTVFLPCLFLLLIGLFCDRAFAVQISRVQCLTTRLDASDLTQTLPLKYPVVPSRTWVWVNVKSDPNTQPEAAMQVTVNLESSTSIVLTRLAKPQQRGASVDVEACAAEFSDGVRVQRGIARFGPATLEKAIKVLSFNSDQAFPYISIAALAEYPEKAGSRAIVPSFDAESTLVLQRGELPSETPATPDVVRVCWQIVEFLSDARVRSGGAKIPHFSDTAAVYLEDPLPDPEKAFVLFYTRPGTKTLGRKTFTQVRGALESKDTVTFWRSGKGKARDERLELVYYLVELLDGSSRVRQGASIFEAGQTEQIVDLPGTDFSQTIRLHSVSAGETDETKQVKNLSSYLFTTTPEAPGKLKLSRYAAQEAAMGPPAQVQWFAAEFASLILEEPRGGEEWKVGETHDLKWSYAANMLEGGSGPDHQHRVEILLAVAPGETAYVPIATGLPVKNAAYAWKIPEKIGKQSLITKNARLMIRDMDDPKRHFNEIRQPFTIKGTLALVAPAGGEVWQPGESHEITWTYTGHLGLLALYYDLESGFNPEPYPEKWKIAKRIPHGREGRGSFIWNPVADVASYHVRLKLVQESDPTVFDTMDADFTIQPTLSILGPNQGRESWRAETRNVILWQSSGTIPWVDLFYSVNPGEPAWTAAASRQTGGGPGKHVLRWTVPSEAIAKTVRIKIQNGENERIFDTAPDHAEGYFSVEPWFQFHAPVPASSPLLTGTPFLVQWDSGGLRQIRLEYAVDGGAWQPVAALASGLKKFSWTVPASVSDQVRLRAYDPVRPDLFFFSDPFAITGKITVLNPSGAELWTPGQEAVLEWSLTGDLGPVRIEAVPGDDNQPVTSTGPKPVPIAEGIPPAETRWVWKSVADLSSEKVTIRITSMEHPSVVGESPFFTILPQLKIEAPVPGNSWPAQTLQTLRWHSNGTVPFYDLFYQTDENETLMPIATALPGGPAGSYEYTWHLPDGLVSDKVRIQIRSSAQPRVRADLPGDFAVQSWVRFKDVTCAAAAKNGLLSWDYGGRTAYVKLEVSRDHGASWSSQAVLKASDRAYTLPDDLRNGVEARLSVLDQPALKDTLTCPAQA